MKKVVMFGGPQHEIPPTKGAAVQMWIYEVSRRLITYQTHIISISHEFLPSKEFDNGIYFHRIHLSRIYKRIFQKILGWDIYSYNKRIFKIIKKIEPDIVHIHNYYDAKEIIEWIKEYNENIKIIFHMHNQSNKFEKREFPKVDIFAGCSNFIIDHYKNNSLVKADKFKTIYNGVDVQKFNQAIQEKEQIKKFLNIDSKTKNIFYIGRISEEKGVDKIVEIAKLLKDDTSFRFYCIGEISKSGCRREYYNNLENIIQKNNLNNIEFLDFIAPQKIHLAYQLADMLIVPSRFEEPFCMVTIEAMASNIPTICASKGGMKEYLENNINSLVIKDYDKFSDIAAMKIKEYFNNCSNEDMVLNAKNMVKSKFNWSEIASEVERVYAQ